MDWNSFAKAPAIFLHARVFTSWDASSTGVEIYMYDSKESNNTGPALCERSQAPKKRPRMACEASCRTSRAFEQLNGCGERDERETERKEGRKTKTEREGEQPPLLTPTDVKFQQWMADCCALRSFVFELKEQRSTLLGLKHALDERVRLWNEGSEAHGSLPWQG